jgi:hypothetical protein
LAEGSVSEGGGQWLGPHVRITQSTSDHTGAGRLCPVYPRNLAHISNQVTIGTSASSNSGANIVQLISEPQREDDRGSCRCDDEASYHRHVSELPPTGARIVTRAFPLMPGL